MGVRASERSLANEHFRQYGSHAIDPNMMQNVYAINRARVRNTRHLSIGDVRGSRDKFDLLACNTKRV